MHVSNLLAMTLRAAPPTAPAAYLDPGSGSFILQLLVAGILGGLVALRMYWSKIKQRLARKPPEPEATAGEDKPGE